MTTEINTTLDHPDTLDIHVHDHRSRSSARKVGQFSLHFLEMLVAMMIGMPVLFALRGLVPASSSYQAAFVRGTNLHDLAMVVFMVAPMVAWMIIRGHSWRHSVEMAAAMSVPVAVAIGLRLLVVGPQPWLAGVSHMGMLLGMLAAMLYRRDHYTGEASHKAHAAH